MVDFNKVASDPRYRDANDEGRSRIRQAFFEKEIAPKAQERGLNLDTVRSTFEKKATSFEINSPKPDFKVPTSSGEVAQEFQKQQTNFLGRLASPERVEQLKAKGEIGIIEGFEVLNKWDLIPLPFVGLVADTQNISILDKVNRLASGEQLPLEDVAEVREFAEDVIEIEARGLKLRTQIFAGGMESLAFGLELAIGSRLGGAGFSAVTGRRTASKAAGEAADRTIKQRLKTAVQRTATGSVATAHRIRGAYADRALNEQIAITEKGDVLLKEAQTAPATQAFKAAGDIFIEVFTEQAGGVVAQPLSKLTGKVSDVVIPKAIRNRFSGAVRDVLGISVNEGLAKFGFNGMLAELGEERLADILRFGAGLDDPDRELTFEGALDAITPSKDQLLVEAGIITIFGAGSRAAVGLHNRLIKKGATPQEAKAAVEGMTETEIRQTLEKMGAIDAEDVGRNTRERIQKKIDRIKLTKTRDSAQINKILDDIEQVQPDQREAVLEQLRQIDPSGQVLEGRKNALVDKQLVLEERISKLQLELEGVEDGRTRSAIQRRLQQAQEEVDQASLQIGIINRGDFNEAALGDIQQKDRVNFTRRQVEAQAKKANAQILTTAKQVFASAQRSARTDTAVAQTQLINFIEASGLQKESVGKFVRSIKNANTQAKLAKQLPKIQRRVSAEILRTKRNQVRSLIKDTLNKTAPKKQSGIKRSKFDAETQRRLDRFRGIINLKKTDAQKELTARQAEGLESTDPLENALLSLAADGAGAPVGNLFNFAEALADVIAKGAESKAFKDISKDNAIAEIKGRVVDAIDPEKVRKKIDKKEFRGRFKKSFDAKKEKFGSAFMDWNEVFEGKLRSVFQTSDRSITDQLLNNDLNFLEENAAKVIGQTKRMNDFFARVMEKTGMSEGQLYKKMRNDFSDVVELKEGNTFTFANGKRRRLDLSRGEMITLWAQMRNPQVKERLMAEEGNAYTQEIVDAIETQMTAQDIAIANSTLEFFNDYYPEIAAKAADRFGVAPEAIDNYIPITAEQKDGAVEDTTYIDGAIAMGTGRLPSFLKERTSRTGRIKPEAYQQLLIAHVSEAEHFLNVSEKADTIRKVFNDPDIKDLIEDVAGKDVLNSILKDTTFFVDRGRSEAGIQWQTLNALLRNLSTSVLAANPTITIKQLTSFPAFMQDVKITDFMLGVVDMLKNPRKAANVLRQSDVIATRWGGADRLDVGFQEIANINSKLNILGNRPKLQKLLFLNIQIGDLGAIGLGGYAHYFAKKRAGATDAEALRSVELLTERTQQSSNADQLSTVQRRKDMMSRMFSRFMSAPQALMRAEMRAVTEFKKGRIDRKEFSKRIFIYHFLIPNLFLMAATAGRPEDDELAVTNILGSFSGAIVLGQFVASSISALIDGDAFDVNFINPFEVFNDILSLTKQLQKNEFDAGDFFSDAQVQADMLKVSGGLTGLPIENIIESALGVPSAAELEREGVLLTLGYSPNVAERDER